MSSSLCLPPSFIKLTLQCFVTPFASLSPPVALFEGLELKALSLINLLLDAALVRLESGCFDLCTLGGVGSCSMSEDRAESAMMDPEGSCTNKQIGSDLSQSQGH